MTTRIAQYLIALPFLTLGLWALLAPHSVERLTVRPEHQHLTAASALFIGCFGAQAILSGLFAAFSTFSARTFVIYGAALLPFFWFNYWAVFDAKIFNGWLAIDFVANVFMLLICFLGWRAAKREAG